MCIVKHANRRLKIIKRDVAFIITNYNSKTGQGEQPNIMGVLRLLESHMEVYMHDHDYEACVQDKDVCHGDFEHHKIYEDG